MGRVITDTEGREAFELWLRGFLPQLFDESFVLEPGENVGISALEFLSE